jgi:hypothetical protein
MNWDRHCRLLNGGSAPATPGFNAVAPEWLSYGAADAAPAIPAAESTLGSHPCVALSSAQVLPEWINRNLAGNRFPANGDSPLNLVSHSRGSLQAISLMNTSPYVGAVGRPIIPAPPVPSAAFA